MAALVTGDVEILIEAADGVTLGTGERWQGLRVSYGQQDAQPVGEFLVVGCEGQSLRDLLTGAIAAVSRSEAGIITAGVTVADAGEQLDLGAFA